MNNGAPIEVIQSHQDLCSAEWKVKEGVLSEVLLIGKGATS